MRCLIGVFGSICVLLSAGRVLAAEIPRAGLELWLKADGEMRLEGRTVVQWNDASGRGNDAIRGTVLGASPGNPILVPDACSSRPVLRFDGSDTWFSFRRMTDMRTIFWVVSKDPAAFGQRLERFVFGDTGFGLLYNTDFHPGTHTKSFLLHRNTSAVFLREGQVRLNGRLVDGTTTDFPKTLGVVSFVSTGRVTTSRLSDDRDYPGRCWQGDIAEIIVYDRVLSDPERAGVEQYLFDKYGIAGHSESLPWSEAWAAAVAAGSTPAGSNATPRPLPVAAIAFSPDGKLMATASDAVRLWDAASGHLVHILKGRTGPEVHPPVPSQPGQFTRVVFSPDGRLLAACGTDLALRLWKVDDGSPVAVPGDLAKKGVALWGFAFSPDGKTLFLNNREKGNDVRRYDVATGTESNFIKPPPHGWQGRLWWLAFSPDRRRIASSAENQVIWLWNADTGDFFNQLSTHSVVLSFAFSPDGKTLAAACVNMTLQLWDVDKGQLRRTLAGHAGGLYAVAYSPDGRLIATGSDDATIRLWAADSEKTPRILKDDGGVWSVAFSPDGRTLASGDEDGALKLWDCGTGRLLWTGLAGQALAPR